MAPEEINIYCDESCHLQNDKQKVMVWGGIICEKNKKDEVYKRIREIKTKHKLKKTYEIKWTKVSKNKLNFYYDLIDYFFDNSDLSFRGVLVPNKEILNFADSNEFNKFYYKMYYVMLKTIFKPNYIYNIFIDKKDTNGKEKIDILKYWLEKKLSYQYMLKRNLINKIQEVDSNQVELVQLSDLFLGAISYVNRNLESSLPKKRIIERINQRGYILTKSTLLREEKFNLFKWHNEDIE